MGDMGDIFRVFREDQKRSRASRQKTLTAEVEASGLAFRVSNYGSHLQIILDGEVINCWPSTDKYTRKDGVVRHGIRQLLLSLKRSSG